MARDQPAELQWRTLARVGAYACRSVPCAARSERVKKIGGLGVEPLYPVGINLIETNTLLVVDQGRHALFVTGLATKVAGRRTAHTVPRPQARKATRKAAGKVTHSVRRVRKRLSRRRSCRKSDFARYTAKRLIAWVPLDVVLVFEDLGSLSAPERGLKRGPAPRRRLALWQHG